MNRLVRQRDTVSNLPEDLREGCEGRTDGRVTIDLARERANNGDAVAAHDAVASLKTPAELFARRRPPFLTDQIDDHLRALRDEWE